MDKEGEVTGPQTPLLDKIASSSGVARVKRGTIAATPDEVRQDMIRAVSQTGGHLGAGLGVVELTVALHYVFDTPLIALSGMSGIRPIRIKF